MAKKFPGLYLYFDWIDALTALPAAKAMRIIKNLSAYAKNGTTPTPLEGPAQILQGLMIASIDRSKINSENGKLGGAPTHKKALEEKEISTDAPAVKRPVSYDPAVRLKRADFDTEEEFSRYLEKRNQSLKSFLR